MKKTFITITLFFLLALSITAVHAATPWKVAGIYVDACSCDIPCPCLTGGMPTQGFCRGIINWSIVHGFYGDVSLSGINISILDDFNENGSGKDVIATYISDNATPEQVEAIKKLIPEALSSFAIEDNLGVKQVPIKFTMSGDTYTWVIPDILELKSLLRRDMPSFPNFLFAETLYQAQSEVYKYKDYGRDWDYSGKNSNQGRLLLPQVEPSDKIVGTIRTGIMPANPSVNPYTQVAVVGNTIDSTLSVFDLTTQQLMKTIPVGKSPGAVINPYTNVAVTNDYDDDTVTIVDLASGTVKKTIPVGKNPVCPGIDTVRNLAFVGNSGSNDVSVIDLTAEKVIKTIPVGMMPMCMHQCINPYTNQAIVANMGENTLSVIDIENGVEIKKIPVGAAPYGASLNPYTNIAVVPNFGGGDVSIVDLTAGKVISTIPVGKGASCSMIETTMNIVLISNFDDDTVSVIDLNTLSAIDTIMAGVQPNCFALNEATMTALISNYGSNDMSIIDLKKIAPAKEDFSNSFFLSLEAGLNMISLPLKPQKHLMARDLMNETGATVIIKYDTDTGKFSGFSEASSGDGFHLEGGTGYIINVKESKVVPFVGAAWTNEPPALAPPSELKSSGWAFVVSGILADNQGGNYTATVRNLRTGDISTNLIATDRFDVVFADMNRNPVVKAGDKVEIVVKDSAGNIVAGPVTKQIGAGDIQRAFSDITIMFGYLKPQNSVLLQNYPNPFNPETWIPFNLSKEADVSVMIYDASGRLVRNLALGRKDAGIYTDKDRAIYWDGKTDAGEDVSSGVYFYTMKAGEFSATRKMIVKK